MIDREQPSDYEGVVAKLEEHGIGWDKWGTGASLPVEKLVQEIQAGEAKLVRAEDGSLLREVHGIGVVVFYQDGDQLLRLREGKRIRADGELMLPRAFPGSVGEKLQPDEPSENAAHRGMAEELDISDAELTFYGDFDEIRNSKRFPGMKTRMVTDLFKCHLTSEQFNREGYKEEQPDKTTYFVWQPVDNEDIDIKADFEGAYLKA